MTLQDIKTIIVMDRANSHGAELTPLATEVQAAIGKPVLDLEYGRGGRNTPLELVKGIYRLGFVLDTDIDREAVRKLLDNPDPELKALLADLELLEGKSFLGKFVEHLASSRLIQAFGPREHIDVRETKKRRDIKLRIIKKVVAYQKADDVEAVEPQVDRV